MKLKQSIYKVMPTTEIFRRAADAAEIQTLVEIISQENSILEIQIFGSAARGEMRTGEAGYRKPSDIDFFLIVNTDEERMPVHIRALQLLNNHHILRPVDIIVWSVEQWKNAQFHALGRAILRDGKILFKNLNAITPPPEPPCWNNNTAQGRI